MGGDGATGDRTGDGRRRRQPDETPGEGSLHWLVDGMNLLGSRPDGWWRDRAGARRRLVDRLVELRTRTGARVGVVFDGRGSPEEVDRAHQGGVALWFAPGGPNAADHLIAEMVEAMVAPGSTTVVTSDGALSRRIRDAGGAVMGVSAFRRLLEAGAAPPGPPSQ